jgi:hypothetical protein
VPQSAAVTTVLVVLLAVVVAMLVVLVAGLLRSHAEILRALHDLGVDLDPDAETAPRPVTVPRSSPAREPVGAADIAGATPHGDAASFTIVGAEQPTMLAFLTSGCSTCAGFWNAFADPSGVRVPADARLIAVTKGQEAESPARLRKFAPPDVPVVMSTEAWEAYDVPVAPYFAFVDGESGTVVGGGAANTWEHVVSMCEQAIADAGFPTPAPARSRSRRPRRRLDGGAREAHVDATLRGAGIEPGDPSLTPRTLSDLGGPE